jgi:hypothetical protein
METLGILLKDSRFWAAVLVLINAVLFFFLPDFPMAIWAAFDALIAAMLAVLASKGAVKTQRAAAARRAAGPNA